MTADPTAAERAREVIADALVYDMEHKALVAEDILDALLANPSLLAALAVEAGGTEQVGWTNPSALYLKRWWEQRDNDDEVEVLVRRVEGDRDE